ncbi:MAG: hypothetical protein O9341_00230 [Paucibacter sp.]|nr:hypothetical protein [Roseateles sp.]
MSAGVKPLRPWDVWFAGLDTDEGLRAKVTLRPEHGLSLVGKSPTIVEQIWNKPRDQRLLWFPAFEVSAQIDGGMSGGPAFDPAGRICGVATRSWTFAKDDLGPPIGYVATLWHSALIPVPRPAQQGNAARRLYDLMKRGVIEAVGLDRLTLGFDATGRIGLHAQPPRESRGCDEQEETSG